MRTTTHPAAGPALAHSRGTGGIDGWILRRLADRMTPAPLRFALGPLTVEPPGTSPVATLRFRDRRAVLGLTRSPELHFGDAFAQGRIEVEGDLVAALEHAYRALEPHDRVPARARLRGRRWHSVRRSRSNVHHHYDLGNDFYRLWLDERLLYTCAYFESPEVSLEAAQVAKMDHVCRKLGLRPGETVVEAGCGWGALALHMARRFGARVFACNVSREQIRYARERAEHEGLADRVEFLEEDYRRLDRRCDVFVSVGMLEHVGRRSYGELADVIRRCLDPEHGRGLLHFIGRDRPRPLNAWITERIFPGAYAPALDEACQRVLVPARQSVLDVENLRRHYELTLRHWRERYERALAEGRVGFDERFRRTWRLYLAGSEAAFRMGSLQLFQVTFAPHGSNAIPWTRAELYDGEAGSSWNAPTS
ncbi:MAG: cyclopropane-fatty-acyl-phospholipid synthase family protein [Acidobacteria bacterium]|nr:cyclopropane-fatty-acyl-phospholipid synthase family protein [Acidobacteriota bacterium]